MPLEIEILPQLNFSNQPNFQNQVILLPTNYDIFMIFAVEYHF